MPRTTIVEIPPEEQARRVAELRRARYGYFLARHVVLLSATGRPPSEIAAVLFCSRSSVYRAMPAYHDGQWAGLRAGEEGETEGPVRCRTVLSPSLKRAVLSILHSAPRL